VASALTCPRCRHRSLPRGVLHRVRARCDRVSRSALPSVSVGITCRAPRSGRLIPVKPTRSSSARSKHSASTPCGPRIGSPRRLRYSSERPAEPTRREPIAHREMVEASTLAGDDGGPRARWTTRTGCQARCAALARCRRGQGCMSGRACWRSLEVRSSRPHGVEASASTWRRTPSRLSTGIKRPERGQGSAHVDTDRHGRKCGIDSRRSHLSAHSRAGPRAGGISWRIAGRSEPIATSAARS